MYYKQEIVSLCENYTQLKLKYLGTDVDTNMLSLNETTTSEEHRKNVKRFQNTKLSTFLHIHHSINQNGTYLETSLKFKFPEEPEK